MTNANHGISGSAQQNAALYTELPYQTDIQDMEVFVFLQTMEVQLQLQTSTSKIVYLT